MDMRRWELSHRERGGARRHLEHGRRGVVKNKGGKRKGATNCKIRKRLSYMYHISNGKLLVEKCELSRLCSVVTSSFQLLSWTLLLLCFILHRSLTTDDTLTYNRLTANNHHVAPVSFEVPISLYPTTSALVISQLWCLLAHHYWKPQFSLMPPKATLRCR